MTNHELEKVISTKIEPLVDNTINRVFGMRLPTITSDISDQLKQSKSFAIDTKVPFKEAKAQFKKYFIQKLLTTFGTITEVSKIAGIKRESLHRLVKQLDVSTDTNLKKYARREVVKSILEDAFDAYRSSLHPQRISHMYENIPALTKDIIEQLPDDLTTMKDAEKDFEKEFIHQAFEENERNISKTARSIGLRFETLHRKMRKLNIL